MLTPKELATLCLICDTLVPELSAEAGDDPTLFGVGALRLGVPANLEHALGLAAEGWQLAGLKLFLRSLEVGAVNGTMAGQWKPFSRLELSGREAVLRAWANSPVGSARMAFQSIKRLALFLAYAARPEADRNPTWGSYGYGGPPPSDLQAIPKPRPIQPLEICGPTILETDVLVIGSGAGGGVVAGELSAAGHNVIVLEKGGYYSDTDYDGRELESSETLYEKSSLLTTQDASMVVMAGSTLGGGTTVNWTAAIRPPDEVLAEWERDFGFTGAAGQDFQASLDAVSVRVNVGTTESIVNPQNAVLERGGSALGYDVGVIPRNVKGCEDCGFCHYGCSFGAKQGTLNTYLLDAYQCGARILVRAQVDRVTHQNGRVTGAQGTVQSTDGSQYPLTIKAKTVVVSAGSIHTPALLKRSGLVHPQIGENLHLHPVTTAVGQYADSIQAWRGAPMTRIVREFANLDGKGYGVRIEVPPTHPGLFASGLPWVSGRQHRRLMQRIEHFASFLVLTRDYHGGHVIVDKRGAPVLHYKLHPYDAAHMMRGLTEAMKIHRAAGAEIIYGPHSRFMMHHVNGDSAFEGFLKAVYREGFKPNTYALFSAHQMSSCRIAGNKKQGALNPSGESYEVQNLFVADGSVLPTASGVNPMMTIMGTAHFIAQQIKARM